MRTPIPAIDRLTSNVIESENGCHEWQGAKRGPMGYSSLRNSADLLPKMIYGHVVSYEHHKGTIPKGMVVRHTCDNPICVNPDHLGEVGACNLVPPLLITRKSDRSCREARFQGSSVVRRW